MGTSPPVRLTPQRGIKIWSRVFLLLVVVQAIVAAIERATLITSCTSASGPAYVAAVIVVIMTFVLFFAFDSVLRRNSFQLISCVFASFLYILRLAYELASNVGRTERDCGLGSKDTVYNWTLASLIVASVITACYLFLIPQLYRTFSWEMVVRAGNDRPLRSNPPPPS
jgi:membrane protein YdbS with pleckstrin-like domain